MMTDDEKFFAWLDGELDAEEAAAVEARVAADPALARLAEQHRKLGTHIKGAFDRIADAPVPERLEASLRPSAQVVDLATARARRARSLIWQFAAMAATLAIGLFVGMRIPADTGGFVEAQGGKLYAAAKLDAALDTGLASAPSGRVRIGLTFRDHSGHICRSFTQDSASGLACREGDRWQVRGLFGAPEGQSSAYRMAGSMDPNLAALVDSTMAGEPFDAAHERQAKARDWR